MTTPSCNKSAYKAYFRYRLRSRLKYLIVTFALNFCSITLLTINEAREASHHYGPDIDLWLGLIVCAAVAQFALTIIGGIRSFGYCLKKESTDTVFSLPITRGEMFRADFLSGYISYVATFVPCSVISLIASIQMLYSGNDYVGSIANLNLALFFSYTFAFVLAALITICCGRKDGAVKCVLISFLLILVAVPVISNFIKLCRIVDIGYDPMNELISAPPLGTFFVRAGSAFVKFAGGGSEFELTELIPYTIYIPIIVMLIAAAYLVFKRRKPENTGNNIAVKGFFYVLSGAVAFILICFVCYVTYSLHMWWLSALISVLVGGLTLLIFTVANKPQRSDLKKHVIRSASIVVGCIAALFIVDKTGAFGARYYNVSPNKTLSVDVVIYDQVSFSNSTYTIREDLLFSSQDDIERLISSCNQTLKNHSDTLQSGDRIRIKYYIDGKKISRGYGGSTTLFNNVTGERQYNSEGIDELLHNIRSLPHYPELYGISAGDALYNSAITTAIMSGKFGEIDIPKDGHLSEILSRDISENFNANADIVGMIYTDIDHYSRYIPIQSGYTDTISYIESLRADDGDKTALSISYHGEPMIEIKLKLKHLEQSAVKELFSLLKVRGEGENISGNEFAITSTDGSSYYVPDENKQHVIELMLTIIDTNSADIFPQQSQQ